jgi:hypothetical protein
MTDFDIYDTSSGLLSITDHQMATEFQFATHQALVNNKPEFDFHGYTIEIGAAVIAMQAIRSSRIYH